MALQIKSGSRNGSKYRPVSACICLPKQVFQFQPRLAAESVLVGLKFAVAGGGHGAKFMSASASLCLILRCASLLRSDSRGSCGARAIGKVAERRNNE